MVLKAPMMLKIGNKPNKSFTLLEVMVTTAVLSLGAALIYEAFFITLDTFDYCFNYLNVASWMDEKIWQAQDNLSLSGSLQQLEARGELKNRSKNFTWDLSYGLIGGTEGLYKIDLTVFWQEGQRRVRLLRSAYALYEKE